MQYLNGESVGLGDQVELWRGATGRVVAIFDAMQFSPEYPEQEWAYLKTGILIDSPQAGLIHFPKTDLDMKLLKRDETM